MPRKREKSANRKLTRVCFARRSTRKRKQQPCEMCDSKKPKRFLATIMDLPNELFLMIFKKLSQEDLVCNVSSVCQRWRDLTATLWKKIDVHPTVSREMITTWISRAPLLTHLIVRDRRDLNEILAKVSENCKQLKILEAYNCSGSPRSSRVQGAFICNLIAKCLKLSLIHFAGTRFNSCKFFRLLPKSRSPARTEISYVGGITYRELCVFLKSVKSHEMKNPTALGVKTMGGRCRLNLDSMNITRLLDILAEKNKNKLAVIIWNATNALYKCYFDVPNMSVTEIL